MGGKKILTCYTHMIDMTVCACICCNKCRENFFYSYVMVSSFVFWWPTYPMVSQDCMLQFKLHAQLHIQITGKECVI